MKEQRIDGYLLSCKRRRFKIDEVMALLQLTYWAKDRDRATVKKSLKYSTPFGVFDPAGTLVGFLRSNKDTLLSTPSIWPTQGFLTSGFGWRR